MKKKKIYTAPALEVFEFEGENLLNGSRVDIYDEETGKFVVVDFKSDSAINPNDHISQLALYKKATAALCNVDESKVETYLFYLRFGITVNLGEYLL